MCMANNGKDTKHTRHISRNVHSVRDGEKLKLLKIGCSKGGLQFSDIESKNFGGNDLNYLTL